MNLDKVIQEEAAEVFAEVTAGRMRLEDLERSLATEEPSPEQVQSFIKFVHPIVSKWGFDKIKSYTDDSYGAAQVKFSDIESARDGDRELVFEWDPEWDSSGGGPIEVTVWVYNPSGGDDGYGGTDVDSEISMITLGEALKWLQKQVDGEGFSVEEPRQKSLFEAIGEPPPWGEELETKAEHYYDVRTRNVDPDIPDWKGGFGENSDALNRWLDDHLAAISDREAYPDEEGPESLDPDVIASPEEAEFEKMPTHSGMKKRLKEANVQTFSLGPGDIEEKVRLWLAGIRQAQGAIYAHALRDHEMNQVFNKLNDIEAKGTEILKSGNVQIPGVKEEKVVSKPHRFMTKEELRSVAAKAVEEVKTQIDP